jgi:hypothetical protein
VVNAKDYAHHHPLPGYFAGKDIFFHPDILYHPLFFSAAGFWIDMQDADTVSSSKCSSELTPLVKWYLKCGLIWLSSFY